MSGIQKYLKSFRQADDLEVGLFEKPDGTQWIRNADGSETQLSGGGSQPGIIQVAGFSFAFDLADLSNGVELPLGFAVGDWLLNAWISVTTPWDGTNPVADMAQLISGHTGLWAFALAVSQDMTIADDQHSGWPAGVVPQNGPLDQMSATGIVWDVLQVPAISGNHAQQQLVRLDLTNGAEETAPAVPYQFTTLDPLKLWVTTGGLADGGDPGATQGEATIFIATAKQPSITALS